MGITSLEDIKKWLVEGKDNPDTFVDLRWSVLDESRNEDGSLVSLRVTHEKIPVNLLILDLEGLGTDLPIIRLVVETGVTTIDLEPSEKLRLYRTLLEASKISMAKFYLFGDEDEIGIAADLNKKNLTREEFETALASLFMGYAALSEIPSIKEAIVTEQAMTLYALVAKWMEDRLSCKEAIKKLTKAGLDKELATTIVKQVYGSNACETSMAVI